jgi:hypothetical protein
MNQKQCVACAEEIKSAAKICRFCSTLQDDSRFLETSTSNLSISESNQVGCGRCGSQNPDQSSECSSCGISLPYEEPKIRVETNDPVLEAYLARPTPTRKKHQADFLANSTVKTVLIVAGIFAVVFFALFTLSALGQNQFYKMGLDYGKETGTPGVLEGHDSPGDFCRISAWVTSAQNDGDREQFFNGCVAGINSRGGS